MISESERLRIAAKVTLLEAGDPERWGATSLLLDMLADSQATIEALIVLVSSVLACEDIAIDRAERIELETERCVLAALVAGRLAPDESARLHVWDFSSDTRRAIAAVALAYFDLDRAPSTNGVLRVLALNDDTAAAVAAGLELRQCDNARPVDVLLFTAHARARRAAGEAERAHRLLRQREPGQAANALRAALDLLQPIAANAADVASNSGRRAIGC